MIVSAPENFKISPKPWSISLANRVTTDVSYDQDNPFINRAKFDLMEGLQGLGGLQGLYGIQDYRRRFNSFSRSLPPSHIVRMNNGLGAISPDTIQLQPGFSQVFTQDTGGWVTWGISPNFGSLDRNVGYVVVYTSPNQVDQQTTVTLTAVDADGNVSTATIVVLPNVQATPNIVTTPSIVNTVPSTPSIIPTPTDIVVAPTNIPTVTSIAPQSNANNVIPSASTTQSIQQSQQAQVQQSQAQQAQVQPIVCAQDLVMCPDGTYGARDPQNNCQPKCNNITSPTNIPTIPSAQVGGSCAPGYQMTFDGCQANLVTNATSQAISPQAPNVQATTNILPKPWASMIPVGPLPPTMASNIIVPSQTQPVVATPNVLDSVSLVFDKVKSFDWNSLLTKNNLFIGAAIIGAFILFNMSGGGGDGIEGRYIASRRGRY